MRGAKLVCLRSQATLHRDREVVDVDVSCLNHRCSVSPFNKINALSPPLSRDKPLALTSDAVSPGFPSSIKKAPVAPPLPCCSFSPVGVSFSLVAISYRAQLGRLGGSRWGWVLQMKFPCQSSLSLSLNQVPKAQPRKMTMFTTKREGGFHRKYRDAT